MEEPKQQNNKRSSADIRSEMRQEGALYLTFERPQLTPDSWWNEWKAMQKYGFFILTTGCIMPYKYFRKTFKTGHKLKGHQRAVHCFLNRTPDQTVRVNQHGWPCGEQISHLCHNPDCVNPEHLVIEPQWKNLRRNYCGENGHCDCGMTPRCVRTYTNPETFANSWTLEADIKKAKVLLTNLHATYPFKILPSNFYSAEEVKSKNRQKRRNKEKKHDKQRSKKAAKRRKTAHDDGSKDSKEESKEPETDRSEGEV